MNLRTPSLIALLALALGLSACSTQQPSETDQRIAQLEKDLEAARQDAATKAPEGAPPADASQAASPSEVPAAPPPGETAGQSAAVAPSPGAERDRDAAARAARAAEQASRDRAATERALGEQKQALDQQQQALAEQKAAAARQAAENAELKRQLEEMKPQEFTLASGTAVAARTTAEISTKSVSNGSTFEALLERDLVVDGTTLAKAGSRVTCVVTSSDPGGKVKGVASLSVAARSIAGVNGNTISVRTGSYLVEAKSTAGKDAARTGIAAGAGAVIGAIAGGGKGAAIGAGAGAAGGAGVALATRGAPAVIPTETVIEFRLSAPATVVLRK